jgi:hypothetical protein
MLAAAVAIPYDTEGIIAIRFGSARLISFEYSSRNNSPPEKKSDGAMFTGLRFSRNAFIPAFSAFFSNGDIYAQFKYVTEGDNVNFERLQVSMHKYTDVSIYLSQNHKNS